MSEGRYIISDEEKRNLLRDILPQAIKESDTNGNSSKHNSGDNINVASNGNHSNTKRDSRQEEETKFTTEELDQLLRPVSSQDEITSNPLSFINDPIDLLYLIDSAFQKGIEQGGRELYPWQAEELLRLADPSYTQQEPLLLNICAANGSGKDAYVISLFAVWHMIFYTRSRCIITSASFKQLDKQTESYIRGICGSLNLWLKNQGICEKALIVKKQHIVCSLTRSEIVLFATDDEQKAEGYHPWPDSPSQKMAIIINEAKSVPHAIFKALRRCTGYTTWLEVSSAGVNDGDFYNHCIHATQYPAPYIRGKRYFRRVTAYDCPRHFAQSEIEEAKLELDNESFGSIYLAQFSSLGEKVVISKENLDNLYGQIAAGKVLFDENYRRAAGLDLSLGGDKTVLTWRTGNRMDGITSCRIKDAVVLATFLNGEFEQLKFKKNTYAKDGSIIPGTPIYTDIGGLGAPIAHMLENMNWNIAYVLNNTPAFSKKLYVNRIAEDWFNLRNAINRGTVILKEDRELRNQLTTRKYILNESNRIKLQSKEDARAEGNRSPDEADSLVLCFCDYEPKIVLEERKAKFNAGEEIGKSYHRISQNDLVSILERERFHNLNGNTTGIERPTEKVGGRATSRSWLEEQIKAQNLLAKKN